MIDETGRQAKGRVAEVSASSLVLAIREKTRTTELVTKTFAEGNVAEIRATESAANGATLGALIGAGLATWDYLIDPSEPGNAAIFAIAIGLGTAIGAGIDALHRGGEVLYAWPEPVPGFGPRPVIAGTLGKSLGDDTKTAHGVSMGTFVARQISVSVEAAWLRPSTTSMAWTSTMMPVPLDLPGLRYLGGAVPVQGTRHTRTPYSISGFVGMHPPNWRRVQWTVLAGLTARRYDERGSSESPIATGPDTYRTEVRDYSSSGMELGPSFGMDAGIALFRHVNLVPHLRLDLNFHRAALRTGLGVQWVF